MEKRAVLNKRKIQLLLIGSLLLLTIIAVISGVAFNKQKKKNEFLIDETEIIQNVEVGDKVILYTNVELAYWHYTESENYIFTQVNNYKLMIEILSYNADSLFVTVTNYYQNETYTVEITHYVVPVSDITLNEVDINF